MSSNSFPTSASTSADTSTSTPTTTPSSSSQPDSKVGEGHVRSNAPAQAAHGLVDRAAEKLPPVVDGVKSRLDGAAAAAHAGIDAADAAQQRWLDESRSAIRSHPLTWVASAVAVGMVLGRMRSSR